MLNSVDSCSVGSHKGNIGVLMGFINLVFCYEYLSTRFVVLERGITLVAHNHSRKDLCKRASAGLSVMPQSLSLPWSVSIFIPFLTPGVRNLGNMVP